MEYVGVDENRPFEVTPKWVGLVQMRLILELTPSESYTCGDHILLKTTRSE